MFRLEVETEGAAFKGDSSGEEDLFQEALEIRRILEHVSGELACGHTSGQVMDFNGNKVGSWSR